MFNSDTESLACNESAVQTEKRLGGGDQSQEGVANRNDGSQRCPRTK